LYLAPFLGTLCVMPTDHHLSCPFCSGDDLTPFPDPTSAWSCLDCARVFRVELVQPASVSGWGVLRVVASTGVGRAVAA
jgi:hypothetical protein